MHGMSDPEKEHLSSVYNRYLIFGYGLSLFSPKRYTTDLIKIFRGRKPLNERIRR